MDSENIKQRTRITIFFCAAAFRNANEYFCDYCKRTSIERNKICFLFILVSSSQPSVDSVMAEKKI